MFCKWINHDLPQCFLIIGPLGCFQFFSFVNKAVINVQELFLAMGLFLHERLSEVCHFYGSIRTVNLSSQRAIAICSATGNSCRCRYPTASVDWYLLRDSSHKVKTS